MSDTADLEIRLKRTVNAAYYALLEMSAWMGIPEKKRHDQIEYLMENVRFCAENDLRYLDKETECLLRICFIFGKKILLREFWMN